VAGVAAVQDDNHLVGLRRRGWGAGAKAANQVQGSPERWAPARASTAGARDAAGSVAPRPPRRVQAHAAAGAQPRALAPARGARAASLASRVCAAACTRRQAAAGWRWCSRGTRLDELHHGCDVAARPSRPRGGVRGRRRRPEPARREPFEAEVRRLP
jgi:hypothetical protein